MELSAEAQKIWEMSEMYSELAPKYLLRGAPRRPLAPGDFGGSKEEARLIFLFPEFPAEFHAAMSLCQQEHEIVERVRVAEAKSPTLENSQLAEHREAFAAGARAQIEGFMRDLSPVQQEIIRAKIFREP